MKSVSLTLSFLSLFWLGLGVGINIVKSDLSGWVGLGDVIYFGIPAGVCALVGVSLALATRVRRKPGFKQAMLYGLAALISSLLMIAWGQTLVNRSHNIHWEEGK